MVFYERSHATLDITSSPGKSSLTISAKPVGVGAVSQRLIPMGEQSSYIPKCLADYCDEPGLTYLLTQAVQAP
jgi:hypothetical protein